MTQPHSRPALGGAFFIVAAITLGGYFTFAAVQGDYGLFRRVQINAEADTLRLNRDALLAQLGQMQNLTHRLSDSYLDIDLLDERARSVLGYLRADEIIIR